MDCKDLLSFLQRNDDYITEMNSLLSNRPNVLNLYYEDLVGSIGLENVRTFVSPYLDLDHFGEAVNKKQASKTLQERVSKYDELVGCIQDTKWKEFLG